MSVNLDIGKMGINQVGALERSDFQRPKSGNLHLPTGGKTLGLNFVFMGDDAFALHECPVY